MDNDRCPYCVRPFADGGGANREHVIGEAFGSRSTIPACAECNSKWCNTIEAPIHKRGSVLDLINAAAGTGAVSGTAVVHGRSDPVPVTVDSDGRPRMDHPIVHVEQDGDRINANFAFPEGTLQQHMVDAISKALERRGVAPERAREVAEQRVEHAPVTSQAISVDAALTARPDLLQRHAAKVTVAASVKAGVPIDSDFTNAVRNILDSENGQPLGAPSAELVDGLRVLNAQRGGSPPAATDGRPAAQVTLTRVSGATLVDVSILGVPHPAGPYLVAATIPGLADGDAIVVREDGQPLRVEKLSDEEGDTT